MEEWIKWLKYFNSRHPEYGSVGAYILIFDDGNFILGYYNTETSEDVYLGDEFSSIEEFIDICKNK
jgi:hypothetical protein